MPLCSIESHLSSTITSPSVMVQALETIRLVSILFITLVKRGNNSSSICRPSPSVMKVSFRGLELHCVCHLVPKQARHSNKPSRVVCQSQRSFVVKSENTPQFVTYLSIFCNTCVLITGPNLDVNK